jgi:hypothetical protein
LFSIYFIEKASNRFNTKIERERERKRKREKVRIAMTNEMTFASIIEVIE